MNHSSLARHLVPWHPLDTLVIIGTLEAHQSAAISHLLYQNWLVEFGGAAVVILAVSKLSGLI